MKTISAEGRLLQMNPAGLRLIEADDFSLVAGKDVFELVHPDFRSDFKEMHRAVLSGERRSLRFQIVGLKGTIRWMETTAVPFASGRGESAHLAITRDITQSIQREAELAKAREEAEAASRAKTMFLANMSHEIRTPLAAIIGFADVARRSETTALKAEALETIQDNGEHLNALLSDLLDLSKIESGQVEIERIPTDLGSVIGEVRSLLAPRAEGRGITLIAESSVLPLVLSDPVRLRQILLNLVGNAIKFTEEGTVTVRAEVDAEAEGRLGVRVVVTDTGIGMSEEQLRRVFEPFQQADASMSRRFGGTGLGLSVSTRLAALLDGTLEAESAEGEGTTMTLALSLPPAPAPDAPEEEDAPSIAGLRILLVEDSPVNARLVSIMLDQMGASVVHATDGADAIARLQGSDARFDVVLMDMQMPILDGYEATRRLRRAGSRVPIVALTAHSLSGDRARCIEAGCDDYVTKPIDRALLARTCARWAAAGQE